MSLKPEIPLKKPQKCPKPNPSTSKILRKSLNNSDKHVKAYIKKSHINLISPISTKNNSLEIKKR